MMKFVGQQWWFLDFLWVMGQKMNQKIVLYLMGNLNLDTTW
jgi:hypothetical protein